MVLICVFLITKEGGIFPHLLAIRVYYLVKCLLIYFAHFSAGLLEVILFSQCSRVMVSRTMSLQAEDQDMSLRAKEVWNWVSGWV